jgi:hypothetical protein
MASTEARHRYEASSLADPWSYDELYHRAVVDDDEYAQYELVQLEQEAEAEEAFWAEEDARREREQWHYYDVVVMRRHLPVFTHRRPVGRERRVACNHRRRGSRRTAARAGPDDPDLEPPDALVPALTRGRA